MALSKQANFFSGRGESNELGRARLEMRHMANGEAVVLIILSKCAEGQYIAKGRMRYQSGRVIEGRFMIKGSTISVLAKYEEESDGKQ